MKSEAADKKLLEGITQNETPPVKKGGVFYWQS